MGKAIGIITLLVILLGTVLFWPSQSPNSGSNAKTPTTSSGSELKVALVTPGAVNDGGWSQNAYNGLQKIKTDLGATTANTVASSPNEAFAAFRDYADRDTNLIIGHASEWFDPKTLEIAAAHPKSNFVISGSERAEGNVAGVRYLLEDACYVLGQVAASMSKTGVLGCVGPKELPVIDSTFFAFAEGAKSVRKDIKVLKKWTNDWSDVARAKEQTLILLGEGADFIFHNANDGAPGVFQAVQEKRKQGAEVFAFGSNADQNSIAPDVILASAVLDIPSAFLNIAKKVKDGSFQKSVQYIGMSDGLVWVSYNKNLESKIPADVRKLADETAKKIKSGEQKVPRLELK